MSDLGPVRFSHLRAYGRSPMHGHHARTVDSVQTSDMQRGTAVHAILFGTRKVIGYPGAVRRGKEYDAFVAAHPDHEILTATEYDKALRMSEAVHEHETAYKLLHGTQEKTLLFKWMGLECRATPDNRGAGFVTELKTSSSADPMRFLWHAKRMAYHAQLRFQEYACQEHGEKIEDHFIVCIESEVPHPVTVFHVEPEALEEADRMLISWAETLKNCEASNTFPGYTQSIVPLVWPKDEELMFAEEE